MRETEFRRVRDDDLPEIRELLCTYYNPGADTQGRYFMAVEGDSVLGVVGLLRRSWYLTELRHLYVKPELRRGGVGRFLVKNALNEIRSPLVCCTVKDGNDASLRLFESEGFRAEKRFLNRETGNWVSLMMRQCE